MRRRCRRLASSSASTSSFSRVSLKLLPGMQIPAASAKSGLHLPLPMQLSVLVPLYSVPDRLMTSRDPMTRDR